MMLAEGEAKVQLPISAAAFGLTAIAIFAALLAITYAFRSVAHRHAPLDGHHSAGHGDAGHGAAGHGHGGH